MDGYYAWMIVATALVLMMTTPALALFYGGMSRSKSVLNMMMMSYLSLGIVGEAQTAAAILGHNYPDSDWYKQSYALLNGSGLQPQQNNDSWISRAFGGGNKTAAANPPA